MLFEQFDDSRKGEHIRERGYRFGKREACQDSEIEKLVGVELKILQNTGFVHKSKGRGLVESINRLMYGYPFETYALEI